MGRPRKHNCDLPRGVYMRHGAYYQVVNGKWIRLGGAQGGLGTIPFRSLPAYKREMLEFCMKLLSRARANARNRRMVEFSLTRDDVERMLDECGWSCQVTGTIFSMEETNRRHPFAPSIDRIDCAAGYTPANCRLVCVAVNLAMNVWGEGVLWRIFSRKSHVVLDSLKHTAKTRLQLVDSK